MRVDTVWVNWEAYPRMREETYAERVADGVIHILGIAFGAAATTAFIMVLWAANDFARQLSIYIYVGTLLAMLICSATSIFWKKQ